MKKRNIWLAMVLAAFAACLVYITILSRTVSLNRVWEPALFRTWQLWRAGDKAMGVGIVENIGLFLPVGYLFAALLSSEESRPKAFPVLVAGFTISLCVEIVQFRTGRGTFEVDDLLHNTAGTALGLLLCQMTYPLQRNRAGRGLTFGVIPVVMLAAGLLGCWEMSRMVVMVNLRTDQFWFSVEETEGNTFTGECRLYEGETPDYQILLTSGKRTLSAQVLRQGDTYSATADMSEGEQYELKVKFRGFPALPTGVYLKDGEIAYIPGTVELPADLEGAAVLEDAVLKACSPEWDCYVFQSGERLIWMVGRGVEDTTEVICHVQTSRPEQLPPQRVEHGFDNLGFFPTQPRETVGSYRCFFTDLPKTYPISAVVVGLNTGEEIVWNSAFRP